MFIIDSEVLCRHLTASFEMSPKSVLRNKKMVSFFLYYTPIAQFSKRFVMPYKSTIIFLQLLIILAEARAAKFITYGHYFRIYYHIS